MKNIALFISMFCYSLIALAQENPAEKIVFKGIADTMYNGSTIIMYNNPLSVIDSAKIANGGFTFTVPYEEPSRYMFYSKYEAKKKGGYAPYGILIANSGTVNIKADMETLAKSVITNAPENDMYNAFALEGTANRQKVMDQLNEKYGAGVIKNLKKTDVQYSEVIKYYNELSAENNSKEVVRLETFIKAHHNAFASIYLLNAAASTIPAAKAESLYSMVGSKYKGTSYGTNIIKVIEAGKLTALGKIAPGFEQPDTSGKIVKLSDFRGQYVLVDFWASWCIPCREENPNIVNAYRKFHGKGFNVLGVSLDQPGKKDAWLKAIHNDHLTWTQVSDLKFWNNAVAKLYGIQTIPQNFLLDKEGKVIAVNIKGEELNKRLLEIFHN
jgi:peroxiredoxin